MSGDPEDPDNEPTVVGPSGAPAAPPPAAPSSPWPEDDERTRIISVPDDERTQIIGATPPPQTPAPNTAVWDNAAAAAPAAPASADLAPGTVLGNYRVGQMIGRGGLGAIYNGVNVHNPAERVAIKTIIADPAAGEGFAKLLLDESNALMRVRHDAVVPYRTYGRVGDGGQYYLVLEFIDGETLSDFYGRRKLSVMEVFALGRRLAAGLQAAHEEGLVHRDVAPDNVLLPQSQLDKATLIDFGIAKVGDMEDMPDTQFAGKLSYAAPEQFVPGARIGPFTDVYSLALVLAAASRGASVPLGRTLGSAQEARRGVPDLPDVPAPLVEPLQRMLEPHPPDRPQSMREVIALLDDAERSAVAASSVASKVVAKPAVKAGVTRTERKPEKKRKAGRGWGGLISVLLALLVGGGAAGLMMYFEKDIFGKPRGWDHITTETRTAETKTDQPPTPPPPPPTENRAETLEKLLASSRTALAAAPCALISLAGSDDGTTYKLSVGGAWGDQGAVQHIADTIGKTPGVSVAVAGKTFDPALCPVADGLKPIAADIGPALLDQPRRREGNDRSVVFHARPPGAANGYYVVEAGKTGQIVSVFDLSNAPARAAIPNLTTLADGSYEIVLTPSTPSSNVDPSLLIALTSATPLASAPAPGPLANLVSALSAGSAKVALDVTTRPGVPAASIQIDHPPPPPPPPPPGDTPEQLVAKAKTAIEAKLATLSCSMTRLTPAADGKTLVFAVGGVWGDDAAVRSAMGEVASATNASINVAGDSVDAALCPALDAAKTASLSLGPSILAQPIAPSAPDRTTTLVVTPAANASAVYLVETDRAGMATELADLSSADAIARAKASGIVEDAGPGSYKVKLKPPSDTANADATLIVALSSSSPLPGAAVAEKSMPLDQWAAEAAKGNAALDIVERAGVAPAAPPPPLPPPPGGDITQEVRDNFAAVECSFINLVPPSGQPKEAGVTGLWGKTSAVQAAADAATTAAGFPFVLKGAEVASRHCAVLNGLKPYFVSGAAVSVSAPAPTGNPDRTSAAALSLDPAFSHFYVLLIDGGGQVRSLVDLTDPAKLAQRIAQKMVIDDGGGRYRLVLPPYSKAADAPSQMLVTVMTTDPLPAEAFGFNGVVALKSWLTALSGASATTKMRVDAAEYIQAPP